MQQLFCNPSLLNPPATNCCNENSERNAANLEIPKKISESVFDDAIEILSTKSSVLFIYEKFPGSCLIFKLVFSPCHFEYTENIPIPTIHHPTSKKSENSKAQKAGRCCFSIDSWKPHCSQLPGFWCFDLWDFSFFRFFLLGHGD